MSVAERYSRRGRITTLAQDLFIEMQTKEIPILSWFAQSAHLNPTEDAWGILQKSLFRVNCLQELWIM